MRAALLVLLLVSGCATSAHDFSFFVGAWSGTTKFATGQSTSLQWTVKSVGEALEGKAIAREFDVEATDRWSRDGERLVRDYSDSQGTKGRLTSSGWRNDVWIWEGFVQTSGGNGTLTEPDQRRVAIRETITRVDSHTMHARYERNDGAGWQFMSEETLTR